MKGTSKHKDEGCKQVELGMKGMNRCTWMQMVHGGTKGASEHGLGGVGLLCLVSIDSQK